jgi:hypothetical protein
MQDMVDLLLLPSYRHHPALLHLPTGDPEANLLGVDRACRRGLDAAGGGSAGDVGGRVWQQSA